MKEINCNIIRDILPLYVDDVVSEDTKEIVEEHLQYCEECRKEKDLIKRKIYIPVEKETLVISRFKKKWKNKKLIISSLSILLTCLILFGAFALIFWNDRIIPYSESLIKIETRDNDMLVSHYYGVDYYSVNLTLPMTLEIDGKEKNVIFFYYTETVAESHTKNLINPKEKRNEDDFIFQLDKEKNVDAIYYGKYDVKNAIDEKGAINNGYWNTVLKNATLIWESSEEVRTKS